MNFTISVTGQAEIDAVLRGLSSQYTHPILQAAHADAAKPLVAKIHLYAPVGNTGRLADSIGIIKVPFSKATTIGEIQVGPRRGRFGGSAAHLNEFGTKVRSFNGANRGAMKAKPFVEPAYKATSAEVLDNISLSLAKKTAVFIKRTLKANG